MVGSRPGLAGHGRGRRPFGSGCSGPPWGLNGGGVVCLVVGLSGGPLFLPLLGVGLGLGVVFGCGLSSCVCPPEPFGELSLVYFVPCVSFSFVWLSRGLHSRFDIEQRITCLCFLLLLLSWIYHLMKSKTSSFKMIYI